VLGVVTPKLQDKASSMKQDQDLILFYFIAPPPRLSLSKPSLAAAAGWLAGWLAERRGSSSYY
jgi:hypothetical protein